MWIVNSSQAALADYIVMLNYMKEEFVDEAFVSYNHTHGLMQLCLLVHEDEEIDIKHWFPMHAVAHYEDKIELDQPLTIEACMLMGLTNSDLVHTKNLENTRSRLCRVLGIAVSATSVVVERD